MQNFMKTIISAVQTWTKGKIKDSTADWNQNDSNADNYVKNRTHWDSRYTIEHVYTFDGNIEGKETNPFSDTQGFVKVTDDAPMAIDLIGATGIVYQDGSIMSGTLTEDLFKVVNDSLYICAEMMIIALEDTEFEGLSFTKGIWGIYALQDGVPVAYVMELRYNESCGELHKLDSKYLNLPTNLATIDDIQNAKQEAIDVANTAQVTANTAVANAATAQSTADSKMDATNPVGTGSFSMNRKAGTTVGDYSSVHGYGLAATNKCLSVDGMFNIYDDLELYTYILINTLRNTKILNSYYCSNEFLFNAQTGKFTLVNPEFSASSSLFGYYIGDTADASSIRITKVVQNLGESNYILEIYESVPINQIKGSYAHIVGNGESDTARSNAHTLDWNGVGWFQGGLQVGGTAQDGEGVSYVPAVPAGATVGQLLAVKAVDENGKPTEWETTGVTTDTTLIEDSTNPITGGAVHEAIEELRSEIITVNYDHAVDGGAW